jgi:hypothetical protein
MAFKRRTVPSRSTQTFVKGDSFAPSQNRDIPLLVQIVEFTEPHETKWTKENNAAAKPAVKVHVAPLLEKVGGRRNSFTLEPVEEPSVFWNVNWYDVHHDRLLDMIESDDPDVQIEFGETFVMKFEEIEKMDGSGTYTAPVGATEEDYEAADEYEEAFGDVFAEGPPEPEEEPEAPVLPSRRGAAPAARGRQAPTQAAPGRRPAAVPAQRARLVEPVEPTVEGRRSAPAPRGIRTSEYAKGRPVASRETPPVRTSRPAPSGRSAVPGHGGTGRGRAAASDDSNTRHLDQDDAGLFEEDGQ